MVNQQWIKLIGYCFVLLNPVFASSFGKVSWQYLQSKSDNVIIGKVSQITMIKRQGDLKTQVIIDVETELYKKGKSVLNNKIELLTECGEDDEVYKLTLGEASFQKGECVLVFIYQEKEAYRTLGFGLGKCELYMGDNDEVLCERDLSGLSKKRISRQIKLRESASKKQSLKQPKKENDSNKNKNNNEKNNNKKLMNQNAYEDVDKRFDMFKDPDLVLLQDILKELGKSDSFSKIERWVKNGQFK